MKNSNLWSKKVFIHMNSFGKFDEKLPGKNEFLQHSLKWVHIWWAIQSCSKCVAEILSQDNGSVSWSLSEIWYSLTRWCIWEFQDDLLAILLYWSISLFHISWAVLRCYVKNDWYKIRTDDWHWHVSIHRKRNARRYLIYFLTDMESKL